MSYLELAKRLRASLEQGDSDPLVDGQIVQTRQEQEPGAVLIASPKYGEVWVALTPDMAADLRAEEAQRPEGRPVLTPTDVAALAGRSEAAFKAALEVVRVFGEAMIQ